jgi:hypothetical protein
MFTSMLHARIDKITENVVFAHVRQAPALPGGCTWYDGSQYPEFRPNLPGKSARFFCRKSRSRRITPTFVVKYGVPDPLGTLSVNRESRKLKLNERSDNIKPAFKNAL